MPVREYAGAARRTTLSGDITAASTTLTVVDATGYPTGATGPFAIALSTGVAGEEKVLIASRSGNTLTVATSGRGYDSTTAAAHQSGAPVDHVLTATDLREANAHVSDTNHLTTTSGTAYNSARLGGVSAPLYLLASDASAAYRPLSFTGARVHRAANQSIPNGTLTAVTFDTEGFDKAGFWTPGDPNNLVVPAGKSGHYIVTAQARFASNTTGFRYVSLRHEGSEIAQVRIPPATGSDTAIMVGELSGLAAVGSKFDLVVFQDSGAALNLIGGASSTFIGCTYQGA